MSGNEIRAKVKRQRQVNTFSILSSANFVLLENTRRKQDGWWYECLTTILMSAFSFEAYLNHLGNHLFDFWSEMERLPHKSKLNIIRSHLRIKPEDGCRPYQTLHPLFKLRDALAHGKSEFLDPPETVETGTGEELRRNKPLTNWEELCTIDFAERAYGDTEAIMKELQEAAGLEVSDLYHSGGHSYSMKRLDSKE